MPYLSNFDRPLTFFFFSQCLNETNYIKNLDRSAPFAEHTSAKSGEVGEVDLSEHDIVIARGNRVAEECDIVPMPMPMPICRPPT